MCSVADLRIGVIGLPGKWSTEALADALETRCGYRRVIDMTDVHVDLAGGSLLHQGLDLGELDGLAVKKICQTYSANTLDRLERNFNTVPPACVATSCRPTRAW